MSAAVSAPTSSVLQPAVVISALAGLAGVASIGLRTSGTPQALLALIGFVAGVSLYHASFGFASAWRRLAVERRSLGVRAQLVMIALAIFVFYPALGNGELLGVPTSGFVFPVGYALCLGAFLFGVGMQLGGGCGSGTLYTVGGGSTRMIVTLVAFIVGSLLATSELLSWPKWPALGAFSLVERLGVQHAIAIAFAGIITLYAAVHELERIRHREVTPLLRNPRGDLLRGPWSVLAGALMLTLVNIATLIVAGRPWGITSAFALWGAKIAQGIGFNVATWSWWRDEPSLGQSVFADATSIMNFGIMLGALAAAGLAGRFAPTWRLPVRSFVAAIFGGLLMGFGARLATGCNIGAFFSGVASGSLHGLVWFVCAFVGSIAGLNLRPRFGMEG